MGSARRLYTRHRLPLSLTGASALKSSPPGHQTSLISPVKSFEFLNFAHDTHDALTRSGRMCDTSLRTYRPVNSSDASLARLHRVMTCHIDDQI